MTTMTEKTSARRRGVESRAEEGRRRGGAAARRCGARRDARCACGYLRRARKPALGTAVRARGLEVT